MMDLDNKSQKWQEKTLERMLFSTIKEQRAKRRWGIFFKLMILGYFIALLLLFTPSGVKKVGQATDHTAVIKISGVIDSQSPANAEDIIKGLNDAFENPRAQAIILELNSPGGSPVQSGEVYDEILRLRKENPSKPVYGVVTDACASGCYYIAAAVDKIYVNEASLVGSIGVLYDGFGFTGLIDKIGVDRRMLTAGQNKGFLDPFQPLKPEDKAFMQGILDTVHTQFIDKVKARRGDKLKDDSLLFSGLVWTGQQAIPLGLADALGSTRFVAREVIGQPVMINYTRERRLFDKLSLSMSSNLANWFKTQLMSMNLY